MLSRIEYVLTETFLSLRRHPMMAFAATTCIAATLFVAGIVGLALLNASNAVDNALHSVRFVVFFQPEKSRPETWAAYKNILKLNGVNPDMKATEYRPKEKYWKQLQREDPDYVKLFTENPIPDAVAVSALDVSSIPALKKEISQWPEVKSIGDAPEVTAFLLRVRQAVGRIGIGMALILLLLSLVIVHHTIELTLYARRKEIHIMSLVGATPATVALPFLLEGIIYGIIGGGISFSILYFLYRFFAAMMKSDFGAQIFQSHVMVTHGLIAMAIAGVCLGLSGSVVSVMKYLHRPRSRVTNA